MVEIICRETWNPNISLTLLKRQHSCPLVQALSVIIEYMFQQMLVTKVEESFGNSITNCENMWRRKTYIITETKSSSSKSQQYIHIDIMYLICLLHKENSVKWDDDCSLS